MIEHPRAIRLTVSDLALAKAWYSQALQTEPVHSGDSSVSFAVGFCTLTLTIGPVGSSPGEAANPAIYWGVDNVQSHYQRISQLPNTGKVTISGRPMMPGSAEVMDPFGNLFGLTVSETQADRQARQQREAQKAALQSVRQTVDQFQAQQDNESKTSRRVFSIAAAALALLVFMVWVFAQLSPAKTADVRIPLPVTSK